MLAMSLCGASPTVLKVRERADIRIHFIVTTTERATPVCVLCFCGDLALKVKKPTKRRART